MDPQNINNFAGNYEDLCQAVNNASGLVVVSFYATWNPTCTHLNEKLPGLARELPRITFFRVNTEEAVELIAHYGICSIPQIKFFKGSPGNQIQELATIIGVDIPQIKAKIQQITAN
ncbi:Thioredoxin family protein [Trichomonas vaginalis G3]|uniref:Thioredoxin family protein n=1 Tax=Trichomonas vaginalis (strain ATCC PRA-98 / G3) TaxID=412133 RepID=A2FZW6_TRIV3|nr:protein disulfide oxidoreductase protein [Trichomonas vaginalis G3]EAX89545.1 Thioredoxin family protein [Trichomonas vaginalis G3]KAI5487461.1 protein disulfide oxidoreductase protein [Trichomonas vaginalis G3]|eukprot:XP_001302475.1 Thioredoxin family protein [Trichomonas vaginalis G3]